MEIDIVYIEFKMFNRVSANKLFRSFAERVEFQVRLKQRNTGRGGSGRRVGAQWM